MRDGGPFEYSVRKMKREKFDDEKAENIAKD